MLGRTAESARLVHSFRHNTLMKWLTRRKRKTKQNKQQQKKSHKTKTKARILQKLGQLLIGTRVKGNSLLQTCFHSDNPTERKLIQKH